MSKPTTTRIKIVLEGTSAGVGKTNLWTALSTTGDDAYIYNEVNLTARETERPPPRETERPNLNSLKPVTYRKLLC